MHVDFGWLFFALQSLEAQHLVRVSPTRLEISQRCHLESFFFLLVGVFSSFQTAYLYLEGCFKLMEMFEKSKSGKWSDDETEEKILDIFRYLHHHLVQILGSFLFHSFFTKHCTPST